MPALISIPSAKAIEQNLGDHAVRPVTAMVFYERAGKLALTTAHEITKIKGVPHLQPGKALAPEDEARIVSLLMNREDESASAHVRINPPNILHSDAASTTWLCPSRVAPMVLRSSVGETTVLARWPTFVMHARNRQLYVVALESDCWPSDDAEVFHSPTGNVWKSTQVCTGSAVLPLSCTPSDVSSWEASWFDSAFTHQNHDRTITLRQVEKVKGKGKPKRTESYPDPMVYWTGKDGDHSAFPVEHLTPLAMTLGQWIASLVWSEAAL
jgi:PRTRC genetic system protein B